MGNLRTKGLAECFQDTRNLLRSIVWNTLRTNGGDLKEFSDYESEAFLLFIKAYDTYDPECGVKFVSYLSMVVIHGLINYYRKTPTWRRRHYKDWATGYVQLRRPIVHRLERIAEDLEGPALQVFHLILQSPGEFRKVMEKAPNKRKVLTKYLKEVYHWKDEEIARAFQDLWTIINDEKDYK